MLTRRQNFMSTAKMSMPTMVTSSQTAPIGSCKRIPMDASGLYLLQPAESVYPFPVFCDQETFIGSHGWTVIQSRQMDGQLSFNRTWTQYRDGFGTPRGEFWLGLERIHQMMRYARYELLIVSKTRDGRMEAARYTSVTVAGEDQGYQLMVGSFVYGSAGRTMEFSHGARFSTPDRPDGDFDGNRCAQQMASGWWFRECEPLPENATEGEEPKPTKPAIKCDKETHPYGGHFYMADPCLAETRIMIREL
ncbi:hypothetical protein quinque_012370 [Culex quinquefasciatus]